MDILFIILKHFNMIGLTLFKIIDSFYIYINVDVIESCKIQIVSEKIKLFVNKWLPYYQ